MIIEINRENLDLLDGSFLDKSLVLNDLKCNPYGRYLVYKEGSNILGYLYYSDIYERAEINQIEVESFHRNCGIGSKLLEKMTSIVDKNITLEVRKDNYSAISLYKKYNFVEVAIRKGYYSGIDGILMERKK